jgi:hypothetical protein
MGERLPLTRTQLDDYDRRAAAGVYAGTMAAFLAWVSGRYDAIHAGLPARIAALRDQFLARTGRPRGSLEVAELAVGTRLFLEWAVDIGALPRDQATTAWTAVQQGFMLCAQAQAETQAAEDVAAKFLESVRTAVTSGRAHLVGKNGSIPPHRELWGWHLASDVETETGDAMHRPQGKRIGFTDGTTVWLDRDASLATARSLAKEHGEPLAVDARGLADRLYSRGLLSKVEMYPNGTVKSKTTRLMVSGEHLQGLLQMSVKVFLGTSEDDIADPSKPSENIP